jgi:hypothetical protein
MTTAAPLTGAALPRLPLYLRGSAPTQVDADGPALLMRVQYQSAQRYPLARLSRIIAAQRVEWRSAALNACQHAHLPIVFLDNKGEPAGYLYPMQGKPSRLNQLIEEVLERDDWAEHYLNWLRAERMGLVRAWWHERQQAGEALNEAELHEQIRRHVYHAEENTPVLPPGSPQIAALTAHVLHSLHQAGLKSCYWGAQGQPLDLTDDLRHLLELALALEMHGLGERLHGEDAALLRILHAYAERLPGLLEHLYGSLHRRLRTLLEEWR